MKQGQKLSFKVRQRKKSDFCCYYSFCSVPAIHDSLDGSLANDREYLNQDKIRSKKKDRLCRDADFERNLSINQARKEKCFLSQIEKEKCLLLLLLLS